MLCCPETMDLQKPLLCGPLTGFSKPRAKMARKPRSATLLKEFVSFFQPSHFSKQVESLYSLNSLQGIQIEEHAVETNAKLTTGDADQEEMNSGKKNQPAGRQVSLKNNDVQARKNSNNFFEGFSQKDLDRKGYGGGAERKRPERFMKELLNRDASNEKAVRGKPANERARTAKKEEESVRLPQEQRGPHRGNEDKSSEHRVGKNAQEAPSQAGRPTKLKLKVGGITHTLQTFLPEEKKSSEVRDASKPESKRRRQRLILQGISDDEDTDIPSVEKPRERSTKQQGSVQTNLSLPKKVEDRGIYSKVDSLSERMDSSRCSDRNPSISPSAQPLRKSSRVVKKRVFDVEEDEIPESEKKRRRNSKGDEDELYKDEDNEKAGFSEREGSSEADIDSLDDEEHGSCKQLRKTKDQSSHVGAKKKKEAPLTARQRALQSSKENGVDLGTSWIEFPDGVPSSTQRKPKVRLTVEEIQAKRAEAARRRKQQTEKAAREIQASAIQKILTQDSVRKKREERLQKQREEIAQSKKDSELEAASNSIRWTSGPNGTLVSWSKDVELPTLFTSGPCSYPPPREKCAAPTCNNAYKYRHSKLKLPLCSLHCYRMVETPSEVGTTF